MKKWINFKQYKPLFMGILLVLFVAITSNLYPNLIIFNGTHSLPTGFYFNEKRDHFEVGDLSILSIPSSAISYLMDNEILDKEDVLLKYILGKEGDYFCTKNGKFTINEELIGPIFSEDSRGNPLPKLNICGALPKGFVVVGNSDKANSFDSRYFGAVPVSLLIGVAHPLYLFD